MTDAPAPAFQGHGSKGYRAYVLGALLIVYTFNFIDRVVIGIIQEPIKAEFGLTDFSWACSAAPHLRSFTRSSAFLLLASPSATIA